MTMQQENYMIPRRLDDPPMFLMWEVDEVIAFMLPVMVTSLFGSSPVLFLVGAIPGFFLMQLVSRLKANGGKQLALQSLYWFLPADLIFKLRRLPLSSVREYIG